MTSLRQAQESLKLIKFRHFDGFLGGICNLKPVLSSSKGIARARRRAQRSVRRRDGADGYARIDDFKEPGARVAEGEPSRRNPILKAFCGAGRQALIKCFMATVTVIPN